MALPSLAMANHRLPAGAKVEHRFEKAEPVDAFEESIELARHARIDLDQAWHAGYGIEAHLHVEHAVPEADALDHARRERVDTVQLRRRERGGILEPLELVRSRIHDRVDRAQHRHPAVSRVTVCGDLPPAEKRLAHHGDRPFAER